MLNSEPDFKSWNEETATRLKLKPLSEDQQEILKLSEEFDEEWEQVVYRACQRDPYLSNNSHRVSSLLNLLSEQIPQDKVKDLGKIIDSILSLSSVTNVEAGESASISSVSKRSKFSGLEEFIGQLNQKNQNEEFLSILEFVHNDMVQLFPNANVSYSKGFISFFDNDIPRSSKTFIQMAASKLPLKLRVGMQEVDEKLPDGACLDWLQRERWRSFSFEINKLSDYNENVKTYVKRSYDLAMKGLTLKKP
jgi:hypothetical protein